MAAWLTCLSWYAMKQQCSYAVHVTFSWFTNSDGVGLGGSYTTGAT